MLKKRWFLYLAAYFFWVVSLILALWLLLVAKNTLPALIAGIIDPRHAEQMNIVIDRAFVLLGGTGWLVLMTVLEQHYRKGAEQGLLWMRVSRVLGVLLALLFLVDGLQAVREGILVIAWTTWAVLLVELGAGAGLLYLSRRRH